MATLFGVLTILVLVLVPGYLIWMLIKTIHDERRSQHLRRVWANFSLSIILCILFFVSWGGQAVSQWREFVQDQREHNQPAEAGEFLVDFGASTLENWLRGHGAGVHELLEGPTSVDVRDDQRGLDPSTIVEHDPVDATVLREDALHSVFQQ